MAPSQKRTMLLVEDHPLIRDGLRAIFAAEESLDIVGEAGDGNDAVRLARELTPDVVVMDVGLPGCDGIEATRQIKAGRKETKIVILTAHNLENEILAGLAAGADAYCIKSMDAQNIRTAVKTVLEGSAYLDPIVAELVLRQVLPAALPAKVPVQDNTGTPLTEREKEVLRLIAEGMANNEIGQQLHISVGTVKGYVRDILEKLYVSDRTQAAVVALRKGLI